MASSHLVSFCKVLSKTSYTLVAAKTINEVKPHLLHVRYHLELRPMFRPFLVRI